MSIRRGRAPDGSKLARTPKEINVYLYDNEGSSLFHILAKLKDASAALGAFLQLLEEERLEILSGEVRRSGDSGSVSFSFFARRRRRNSSEKPSSQSPAESAAEIARTFWSCPFVEDSVVTPSSRGLIVDSNTYPVIFSSGQRAVLLRQEVLAEILRSTRKRFGSGGDVIVFDQGFSAGLNDGEELVRQIGKEKLFEGNLESLVFLYKSLGWGISELTSLELDPFVARLKLTDSFECSGEVSGKPSAHFIRGHMVGLTASIFDIKVKCVETKCISAGNEYCEFVLTLDEDDKS